MKSKLIPAILIMVFGPIMTWASANGECVLPAGQIWKSHYQGLDADTVSGVAILQGHDVDPQPLEFGISLFPWDDGIFVWTDLSLPPEAGCAERFVHGTDAVGLALSSGGPAGGMFIIDQAVWDAELQAFNADAGVPGPRQAGSLPVIGIEKMHSAFGRWVIDISLVFPLTGVMSRIGRYSDLVAGILIIGARTPHATQASAWQEITFVPAPDRPERPISVRLSIPDDGSIGYLAATLVAETGGGGDWKNKPVLRHHGPVAPLFPQHPTGTYDSLGATVQGLDESRFPTARNLSALGDNRSVLLRWQVPEARIPFSCAVYESYEGSAWILMTSIGAEEAVRCGEGICSYEWTHALWERAPAGLYYLVRCADGEGGAGDEAWTRARMKDWR